MWVRNNKGNVFVGNLPPDFTDERLAEAFDPFGIVLTAAVARDPSTGARLRYGFVDIATERAATQAIAALDGSEIDGCKLNVKPQDVAPRRQGRRGAAAPSGAARRCAERDVARRRAATPHAGARRCHAMPVASVAKPVGAEPDWRARGCPRSSRRRAAISRSCVARFGAATPSFQVERRPLPRRV